MNWRPTAYAAGAILVAALWLSWCHDPAVRKEVRLRDAGRVTDSSAAVTDRRLAVLAAREVERESTLARTGRALSSARQEVARLRNNAVHTVTDSTPRDTLLAQIAVRDSVIERQGTIIAQQDSQLTIWTALAVERGELLTRALGERDAYRAQRDAWQHQAHPGILTRVGRALPYLAAGYLLAKLTR